MADENERPRIYVVVKGIVMNGNRTLLVCRNDYLTPEGLDWWYVKALDEIGNTLGIDRLRNMHIHFSKIEYTAGGEKRHLTFADEIYGPQFEPLIEQFILRDMSPSVICESAGTQTDDAAAMMRYYKECSHALR